MTKKEFFEKHDLIRVKKNILYPIIVDTAEKNPTVKGILKDYSTKSIKEAIVGGLSGAIVGIIEGSIVGGVVGGVIGAASAPFIEFGTEGFYDYVSDIYNPFRKYFKFNTRDFICLRGFKKDLDLESKEIIMVTQNFEHIEWGSVYIPNVGKNDDKISRTVVSTIGGSKFRDKNEEQLLSRYDLDKEERYDDLLEKDVISIGAPLPIEPIYHAFKEMRFPLNFETENPTPYFPNKPYKKWEIKVKDDYEKNVKNASNFTDGSLGYIPEWNKYNYGLITICNKNIIFGEGKGTFINIGGCNWQGTEGCASYFYEKDKLEELIKYLGDYKKSGRSVQVVIKTELDKFGRPILQKTETIDKIYFS